MLFKQRSDDDETGHSSVVEMAEGHRRRVGDVTAVLPTPPVKQIKPADAAPKQQ